MAVGVVTRSQAEARLAERGLVLVPVFHESDLGEPDHYLVAYESGGVVSEGRTWQWAFAEATGEAPF